MSADRYTDERRAQRRARGERMRKQLGLDIDVDALMYTADERADAAQWLAEHGWQVEAVTSATEMARLGRPAAEADLAEFGMDGVLMRARLDGEHR
jgi:O-methyltransferase involved in polyketide biosynthesis